MIAKKLMICLALLVSSAYAQIQKGRFPNTIGNSDCDILLSPAYDLEPGDITPFVKTGMADIQMIKCKGYIKEGPQTERLNVVIVNKMEEKKLFPTKEIRAGYQAQVADFFTQLPGDAKANENKLLIFTARQGPVSSVAFFHFENGRVVGYIHPFLAGGATATERNMLINNLESELKFARENHKTLIWAGEDIGLDINESALKENTLIYRRPPDINRLIPLDFMPLNKKFDPATASVVNAVPSTKQQLIAGGFSINRLDEWQSYKNEVETITKPRFGKAITDITGFKNEVVKGDGDVLLIVAHLKGSDLYLGDTKLTLDEIRSWGKRETATGGKRSAYLFICNAGNQRYTTGSLFWKKTVTPLANILLDNHYFDMVLAPDHTILRPETINTLKKLLGGHSMLEIQQAHRGWQPYVFTLKKPISNGRSS